MAILRQPRVHILGLGSIGTFAAHALAEIPNRPRITLLLHRPSLLESYVKNGRKISLKENDGRVSNSDGYSFETLHDGRYWYPISSEQTQTWHAPTESLSLTDIVENLVVCVKTTQTVNALRPLKERLTAESTILFLQNGSGMIEEVNEHLFTDPETRPNYITGVISHGVSMDAPFDIMHTGVASTSVGPVPRSSDGDHDSTTTETAKGGYLLDTLISSPRLNATSYAFTDVFQIQLEKLALNAFSNPISALNDSAVNFLFSKLDLRREILTETSRVVLALPELKGVQGVSERFSVDRLEATTGDILTKNAESTCSMVWDLRAGRETEVKFINGYWSRRGRDVGVPTPVNDSITQQVVERWKEIVRQKAASDSAAAGVY